MELTQAATWHRQAAALVAAADRVGVGVAELPARRDRLVAQQARLTALTAAAGGWPLALTPTPADIAAAMPALGDLSPVAVETALAAIDATLDAVDAGLVGLSSTQPWPVTAATAGLPPPPDLPPPPPPALPPPPPPSGDRWPGAVGLEPGPGRRGIAGWSPTRRNLTVYAGYAVAITALQLGLFISYSAQNLSLLGPCCLIVLPVCSWAAGWVTVGIAFGTGPADRELDRSPRLGALVSLLPIVLFCSWLGVLLANA